jgi:endonuclease/exonuclease/phosphatase family metal-dependent hydrolase
MKLKIVTYNVLADAYLLPDRYPDSPPVCMEPSRRTQSLVAKVLSLNADLICLQEVEPALFDALRIALEPLGYSGWLELRKVDGAEGCAIFHRGRRLRLDLALRFDFPELPGTRPCQRLAQIAIFDAGEKSLAVANTHLQWDSPTTTQSACRSLHQVDSLLAELRKTAPDAPTIICGDFNVEAQGRTVNTLLERGFRFTHKGDAMAPTCRANGQCRMIDFIFHSSGINVSPAPIEPIDPCIPMPGNEHTSDHVPVSATLQIPNRYTADDKAPQP